jgi:hypothetical protein
VSAFCRRRGVRRRELLAEAHVDLDTPLAIATFFAGFLPPLVIAAI